MVWIQTVSGNKVDLQRPDPDTIDIRDIAHALSMLCRFCGHTYKFYSIAEHSVRVMMLVPPGQELAALLHDASEAYIADISRPLKSLLPDYKQVEDNFEYVINYKYGLDGKVDHKAIKKADNIMLATEGRDLLMDTTGWNLPEPPLAIHIEPWLQQTAELHFLEQFYKYEKNSD